MSYTKRFYEKVQEERETRRIYEEMYCKIQALDSGYVTEMNTNKDWELLPVFLAVKGYRQYPKHPNKDKVYGVCITPTTAGLLIDFLLDSPYEEGHGQSAIVNAYVVNMDHPEFSEYGSVLYEIVPGSMNLAYHRIG